MKIISSIGPNAKEKNFIDMMVKSGTDTFRFNLSHGNLNVMEEQIDYIKKKYPQVELLGDLQGNKIRVDKSFNGEKKVVPGEKVRFSSPAYYKNVKNKDNVIPLSFKGNFSRLYGVREISMKDGTMKFEIQGINKNKEIITAEVILGGIIRAEKGVNAINMDREEQGLTEKDKKDIRWAIMNGIDIIDLSYVSSVTEIEETKLLIRNIRKKECIVYKPKLWAKIECREGIEDLYEISKKVDGIIIGRGDLCCEIPAISVPIIENKIIDDMKRTKKDIIVATHVLDSMKYSDTPYLSEIESIYRFVERGVTGFMLCGETNIGKYPIESIKTLKNIIDMYCETLI